VCQTCQTLPVVVDHAYMMASASSTYNITKLVYFEPFSDIRNAIACEKQWKTWRREKKIALIERLNPLRRDLSEDFNH
jgi:putative endonuclease